MSLNWRQLKATSGQGSRSPRTARRPRLINGVAGPRAAEGDRDRPPYQRGGNKYSIAGLVRGSDSSCWNTAGSVLCPPGRPRFCPRGAACPSTAVDVTAWHWPCGERTNMRLCCGAASSALKPQRSLCREHRAEARPPKPVPRTAS